MVREINSQVWFRSAMNLLVVYAVKNAHTAAWCQLAVNYVHVNQSQMTSERFGPAFRRVRITI